MGDAVIDAKRKQRIEMNRTVTQTIEQAPAELVAVQPVRMLPKEKLKLPATAEA